MPKTLLEAAACGLPLIATDVPGCREVAVHEATGLLVPPRDSAALAEAMRRLDRDAELRRRLGAAGRQRVMDNFSTERITDETIALYRELMEACASA